MSQCNNTSHKTKEVRQQKCLPFRFTSPETNEQTMQCNLCPYRTASLPNWRAHKSRHRADLLQTFKCQLCDFTSKQGYQGLRGSLIMHIGDFGQYYPMT